VPKERVIITLCCLSLLQTVRRGPFDFNPSASTRAEFEMSAVGGRIMLDPDWSVVHLGLRSSDKDSVCLSWSWSPLEFRLSIRPSKIWETNRRSKDFCVRLRRTSSHPALPDMNLRRINLPWLAAGQGGTSR